MIPQGYDIDFEVINDIDTTKTYKLSSDKMQGFTDDLGALEQTIYKTLNTERYEYPIYSFNYGVELEGLIGKDPVYVQIELKRRIKECLLQDERINTVDSFEYTVTGDEMLCTFYVNTIYGAVTISREVRF